MADKDRSQDGLQGSALAGIGFELAAAVAGLTLLGYWIDRHFDSSPWGILIGACIGLVGGTYNTIRAALRTGRKAESDRAAEGKAGAGPDREP